MDANIATIIIAAFTMITSITTATLLYYTNRRTKRIEASQHHLIAKIAKTSKTKTLTNRAQEVTIQSHEQPSHTARRKKK